MMKQSKCLVCKLVGLLVALGAINWGLFGVFGIDLVARFLGIMTTPAKVAYGLIGVAGVIKLLSCFVCCPCAKKDEGSCKK